MVFTALSYFSGWLDQLRIKPPQPPTKAGVWAGGELGKNVSVISIDSIDKLGIRVI